MSVKQPTDAFKTGPNIGIIPRQNPLDNKVQEAVKHRSTFENIVGLAAGLTGSKIFRAAGLGAASIGIALCILFMVSNPVGWIATATGLSITAAILILTAASVVAFALSTLLFGVAQIPLKGTMEFETSALGRLFTKNYNEIALSPRQDGHKLFLGALPNALTDYEMMQEIVRSGGTVISINEDWELDPNGVSVPMRSKDYNDLGINCVQLKARDHEMLSPEDLDKLADKIHEGLQQGNVYIHCRAGVGRSASGIAAYLMKYEGKSIEQACAIIKDGRPKATIWNKLHGLREYASYIEKKYHILPKELSALATTAADYLEESKKKGKTKKLSKEIRTELQESQSGFLKTLKPI